MTRRKWSIEQKRQMVEAYGKLTRKEKKAFRERWDFSSTQIGQWKIGLSRMAHPTPLAAPVLRPEGDEIRVLRHENFKLRAALSALLIEREIEKIAG